MSQAEKMCEDCAGGGSRWIRVPSRAPYEIERIVADSGSGMGYWAKCESCKGKGFIPLPVSASGNTELDTGPCFCEACGAHPASQTPKGKRCHTCWILDVAADNPVPLPDGKKCLEDLASIGVPGAAEKLIIIQQHGTTQLHN